MRAWQGRHTVRRADLSTEAILYDPDSILYRCLYGETYEEEGEPAGVGERHLWARRREQRE
jgi:hypothetical protein